MNHPVPAQLLASAVFAEAWCGNRKRWTTDTFGGADARAVHGCRGSPFDGFRSSMQKPRGVKRSKTKEQKIPVRVNVVRKLTLLSAADYRITEARQTA
eukprot:543348-Pleurochrysis_carterae.AAC.1